MKNQSTKDLQRQLSETKRELAKEQAVSKKLASLNHTIEARLRETSDLRNELKRLRDTHEQLRRATQENANDLVIAKQVIGGLLIRGFDKQAIVWRPQDYPPKQQPT
jgi:predicted nuclease with TOPRIM domain